MSKCEVVQRDVVASPVAELVMDQADIYIL